MFNGNDKIGFYSSEIFLPTVTFFDLLRR